MQFASGSLRSVSQTIRSMWLVVDTRRRGIKKVRLGKKTVTAAVAVSETQSVLKFKDTVMQADELLLSADSEDTMC